MVQAALVLPLFLGLLFLSIKILMASYKMLMLQDIVAEVTREAFTKTYAQRGSVSWQNYIQTNIFNRAKAVGVTEAKKSGATATSFWSSANPIESPAASSAVAGDIYSLWITVNEPVLASGLGVGSIPLKAKGIAVVQMGPLE